MCAMSVYHLRIDHLVRNYLNLLYLAAVNINTPFENDVIALFSQI